jgi:hypothetical protein
MSLFKNKPFFLNIILFGLICLQVSIYAFIWGNLLNDPSLKGMDFISFYTAGRIANEGKYHELFDLDTQRSIQWKVVSPDTFPGGVNLSQHPPYLSPLLAVVMTDDFVQAYFRWSIVRLLIIGVVGYLVWKFLLIHHWEP